MAEPTLTPEQKAAVTEAVAALKTAESEKAKSLTTVDTASTAYEKALEDFNKTHTEASFKTATENRDKAHKALEDAREADEKAAFAVDMAKAEHNAVSAASTRKSNEWQGARFTLLDTNSDGIPNAILVTPIDTVAEAKRFVNDARYAPYHKTIAEARAAAAYENRGRSALEITTAVEAAVEKTKADWKGPVPIDVLRAEADAVSAEQKAANAAAEEAKAEKQKAANAKALSESNKR